MTPSPDWIEDCEKYWGRILTGKKGHWCPDWDYLPIDETCDEYRACNCKTKRDMSKEAEQWIKENPYDLVNPHCTIAEWLESYAQYRIKQEREYYGEV